MVESKYNLRNNPKRSEKAGLLNYVTLCSTEQSLLNVASIDISLSDYSNTNRVTLDSVHFNSNGNPNLKNNSNTNTIATNKPNEAEKTDDNIQMTYT